MLFDTDIIIWIQRGNQKAARAVDEESDRFISVITYMELLQNAQNKEQHLLVKKFLNDFEFITLPLSENIGHRASIYIEEYSLGNGITADDALIAATSIENNQKLLSGNYKHYKVIRELDLKRFIP
jgi:predicted nucleic acid-binding protein